MSSSTPIDARRYPESDREFDNKNRSLHDIARLHTFLDPEDHASLDLPGRTAFERYPYATETPSYPLPTSIKLTSECNSSNEGSGTLGSTLIDYGHTLRDYHLRQQHRALQSALGLLPSSQGSQAAYSKSSLPADLIESASEGSGSLLDASQLQSQSQVALSSDWAYETSNALEGEVLCHKCHQSSISMSNTGCPPLYHSYPCNHDLGASSSLQFNPLPHESLPVGDPVRLMHGLKATNDLYTLQANTISQESSDPVIKHSPMEGDLSSSMEVTPDLQLFSLLIDLEEQTEMAREKMQEDLAALKRKKKAKLHECTICQKRFPRPSGLKTHMNIHNNKKPYVCEFPGCNRTFGVRSNARRHLRTHGVIPPPAQSVGEEPYVVGFSEPLIMPSHEPPFGPQESRLDGAEQQGVSSKRGERGRRPALSRVAAFRVRWQTPKMKKAGDVATSGLPEDEAAQPDDSTPRPNRFQASQELDLSTSMLPLSPEPPTQASSSSAPLRTLQYVQQRRR